MKRTPLHIAAEVDNAQIASMLVTKGADANFRDFDESTPLHFASEYGSLGVLEFLLNETNANPSMKNKFGHTPSDIA